MDEYLLILDRLFTPQQQTALVIITAGVMSLTQVFKNVYFGFFPVTSRAKKKAILWLAAFTFGVSGGVAGYLVGTPAQPLWFWIFTGVASGGTAIGLFRLFIGIMWPRIRSIASKK